MGTEIHWLAVLVAGVAGFMVGGVWYSALFGKAWMAARGVTQESMKGGNVKLLFGITFMLDVVMAFFLDHVLGTYTPKPDLSLTLMIAGGLALGFVIPAMGVNYLYQQASRNLFLIDAGHWLFAFLAMGAVLALMS
ncbi:MAG: DUF1761 domain-containing protein [Pseudomonadota bacterium]